MRTQETKVMHSQETAVAGAIVGAANFGLMSYQQIKNNPDGFAGDRVTRVFGMVYNTTVGMLVGGMCGMAIGLFPGGALFVLSCAGIIMVAEHKHNEKKINS